MSGKNDASGVQNNDDPVTRALVQQLIATAREGEVSFEALRRLTGPEGRATLRRMVDVAHDDWTAIDRSKPSGILVVPDLAAVDLTALVKKNLRLQHVDPLYESWNYDEGLDGSLIPGRGESFEYLCWEPPSLRETPISPEAVRKHFRDLGFYGHVGAFTWWRCISVLRGRHASIPEDSGCWRSGKGPLCFPHSYFDIGYRTLNNGASTQDPLGGDWTFVGFRKLP